VIGRIQNKSLISLWTQYTGEIFVQQFSNIYRYVSQKADNMEDINDAIMKTLLPLQQESSSESHLYCTGRKNIDGGCRVVLDLKKRHDLFWSIYELLFTYKKDTMTLEIALTDLPTCVFALVPRRLDKDTQLLTDVKRFASRYEVGKDSATFPANKILLTDTPEFANATNKTFNSLMQLLKKHETLVESVYFSSDHNKIYPGHKNSLRFVFYIPSNAEKMKQLAELLSYALVFVDVLPTLQISRDQLDVNERRRKKVNDDLVALIQKKEEEAKRQQLQKLQQQKKTTKKDSKKR
jgi:hypothetical protein